MLRFELGSGCYLRLFEESDAEELERVVAANRAYLAKWLGWANATEAAERWLAFIRRTREKVAANDGFVAAIIDGDAIVGWVGFDRIDWQPIDQHWILVGTGSTRAEGAPGDPHRSTS